MSNVVSLDAWRAKKKPMPEPGESVTILMGAECGNICHHCGDVMVHAMVIPHGKEGKACRDCKIWFDGMDDLYR